MFANQALLGFASLAFVAVNAAPAPAAVVSPRSISESCVDISYYNGWRYLTASCLTGNGNERIRSAVAIDAKVSFDRNTGQLGV